MRGRLGLSQDAAHVLAQLLRVRLVQVLLPDRALCLVVSLFLAVVDAQQFDPRTCVFYLARRFAGCHTAV